MKQRLKTILSATLVAPLLVFGSANALAREDGTDPNKTVSNDTAQRSDSTAPKVMMTQAAEDSTADSANKTELLKRLESRKAALKTRLTTVEQKRYKERCKNAQGKLSAVSNRINGIETSRNEVHGALISRLSTLQSRLQSQGVDATKLQTDIDALKAKIETFKVDLATYKQAVSDLAAMDCQSDPAAFKASLETARSALAKLKQDGADIKSYLNDTVKVTLKEIRSQLEGVKTGNQNTSTNETSLTTGSN
jgi:DNA repair exonuclease SbcCD ATPase subunit